MVAEYVASIKAAWDLAKAIKTSADAIDDAQIKLQIAELISALADAKIEAAENAERISELERQIKSKSEMLFEGRLYYRFLETGNREGPFCPTCYDKDGKTIRLQPNSENRHHDDWRCHGCGTYYGSST
jgi:hypothetical protein